MIVWFFRQILHNSSGCWGIDVLVFMNPAGFGDHYSNLPRDCLNYSFYNLHA